MASSWQDLWKFANSLRKAGAKDETIRRAAISREYYACYHRACEFALKDGSDPWTKPSAGFEGSEHTSLWNHFKRHWETDGAETLQKDGKAAHKDRKRADYDLGDALTLEDANKARERAELVMEQLGVLDGEQLPA